MIFNKYFPLTYFLALFVLYTFGVSNSVYGGDSGDIILASWFGGVAHPPGYPINTMIGWIFTHLPIAGSVAFRANLMAAFFTSVSVVVWYLILQLLLKNKIVAFVTSLIVAFVPLIWLYAHIIEVFQLNVLLVTISVYFLFKWYLEKSKNNLIYSIAFLGLAVFHHHTSVLIFPAYLYLILKAKRKEIKNKKYLLKLFCAFFAGFLPYVFIPFAALRQTPINWDDPSNLQNFIRLITRADYGTFIASTQIFGSEVRSRILHIVDFFYFIKSDFSLLGSILILSGSVYCYLKQREIFFFVLISAFFTGPFFLFYSSFPLNNNFFFGLWERFVILAYFLLSIFLGYGILLVFNKTLEFSSKFKTHNFSSGAKRILIGGLLLLLPFCMFFINYPKADLSKFFLGDYLGYDVLTSVENDSILLIFADTIAFNTQYVYYTNPNYKNVKLILAGQLRHLEYREQIMRQFPEIKFPDGFSEKTEKETGEYIISFINANLEYSPIYTTDYRFGIEGHKWMKTGLSKKLVKDNQYRKEELISQNNRIYNEFKFKDFSEGLGYEHFITTHIKEVYHISLIELVDELIVNGTDDEAKIYLEKAKVLLPGEAGSYARLGNLAFKNKECINAENYFKKAYEIDGNNWRYLDVLSGVYKDCFGDEAKFNEYQRKSTELKSKFGNSDSI